MNSDDDYVATLTGTRSRSCCGTFWGPFRPLFGGHQLSEAATSAFLPTPVVVLYRASAAIFLLSSFLYYVLNDGYKMTQFSSWCHVGLGISFALTTSVSLIFMLAPPRSNASLEDGHVAARKRSSSLAFCAIVVYQVFATAALFLDVVYWALIYNPKDTQVTFRNLSQHGYNLGFVILDICLSMRMQFKMSYMLAFLLYTISYLVYMWVRFSVVRDFTYSFLDYRGKSPGNVVGYYLGLLAWAMLASVLMIVFSRLSRLPCLPPLKTGMGLDSEQSDDVDADSSLDDDPVARARGADPDSYPI